jgi:hypothetical protein
MGLVKCVAASLSKEGNSLDVELKVSAKQAKLVRGRYLINVDHETFPAFNLCLSPRCTDVYLTLKKPAEALFKYNCPPGAEILIRTV